MNTVDKAAAFIGIDIGGTFTDAAFFIDGKIHIKKTPTTVEDPAKGVMQLLTDLEGREFILTHGSTLATNAVLERKGAKTALLATKGFKDLLTIARQNRPQLYSLEIPPPAPLVDPSLCYGVPERIDYLGDVLKYVDVDRLKEMLLDASDNGAQSLAVCLLFSYKNPVNETKVYETASGLFNFVSASSDVLPEYREYERASTTVLNAYVSPILSRYISRLKNDLKEIGARDFKIMESGGGIIPATEAGNLGVRTILSGPAGGVAGAFHLAKAAGFDKIITLDMGGTSTDVSLCDGGIGETREGDIDGFPIRVPMVDVVTIGAGGGSIAKVDAAGILKVGPESAGADPGPAAYGKSEIPTVTDAHMVLGTVQPGDFLGGDFEVDKQRSEEAVGRIAEKLNLKNEEAAEGIIRIALSHMERALRIVSLERGHDPHTFTLVPFGGAGPLHGSFLADRLAIDRVLIPRHPGVLSAFGMLVCNFRMDFTKSLLVNLDNLLPQHYGNTIEELYEKASGFIYENYFQSATIHCSMDLRYKGQSFELNIRHHSLECEKKEGMLYLPQIPTPDVEKIIRDFHTAHKTRYGFARNDEPVELVNVRIDLAGYIPGPSMEKKKLSGEDASSAGVGERDLILPMAGRVTANAYSREKLKPGNVLKSPSVVIQYDSVIIIPPGWSARVDEFENLIMEKENETGN